MATGANALVSIFSERESHAVWFLKSLNMTRLDAVSFISHGSESSVAKSSGEDVDQETAGIEGKDPLIQFAVNLITKAAAGRIDPLIGRDVSWTEPFRCCAGAQKTTHSMSVTLALGKQQLLRGSLYGFLKGRSSAVNSGDLCVGYGSITGWNALPW